MHLILTPLTPPQENKFWENYKAGDAVFRLPGIKLSAQVLNVSQDLLVSEDTVRNDVVWFHNSILSLPESSSKQRLLGYSDIISMYVLRYLFAANYLIDCHLLSSNRKVYVYSAKSGDSGLPVAGFSTNENPRGSRLVLGAYVSNALSEIFADRNVVFVERPKGLLSYRWVRLPLLMAAEIAFVFNFVFKIIRVSFFYGQLFKLDCRSKNSKHVFLVRVPHHARFLNNIISAWPREKNVDCLILPQARQGSVDKLLKSLEEINKLDNVSVLGLNILGITKLFLRSSKEMCHEMFIAMRGKDRSYTITYGKHVIKLDSVLRETSLFFSDYMYINALRYGLGKRDDSDKLVSFSMKGRYSCMESRVAKKKGMCTVGIQTAALDSFPSAVFPWFDVFYANSSNEVVSQKNIGVSSLGEIVFSGAPQHVDKIKKNPVIKKISYFTQPYDHATTEFFLAGLIKLCKENKIILTIKLHPRDSLSLYRSLAKSDSILVSQEEAGEVISNSDIVLARTSSVLYESAMSGVLTFACTLSNIDTEFNVDYLCAFRAGELTVSSVDDLKGRLCELPRSYDLLDTVRKIMGVGKGVEELVHSLQEL